MAGQPRPQRGAAHSKPERNNKLRTLRIGLTLLAALGATFWVGRALGLSNDELFSYLLASVGLVAASALVALIVFGLLRLFRR